MPADFSPPSIPNHVSTLPALPVTQTDPPWQGDNYPTVGTSTQSPSSSPAHSPSRDTPTPIDNHAVGVSKGKKRSRGRYRKEDPADRYLRENMEDGNRLWTCMWVEPSHDTLDSPAAQSVCGHQAPKSNARQHVKSRHLKLRYVSLLFLGLLPLSSKVKLTYHCPYCKSCPNNMRKQAIHLPRVWPDLARPRRTV